MKKILLSSTLLMLIFFTNVYGEAQKYKHPKSTQDTTEQVKFGVKLKPTLATLRVVDDKTEESMKESNRTNIMPLYRLSFDLFGEYALNDVVGIQLSLGYSRQGYSIIMPSNQGVLTGTTQKVQVNTYLNYIMLSVVPRFYPGIDRQFCLFVGPSFSWLASAERQVSRFIDGKKEGDTKKLDLLGDEWPKGTLRN